jgi:hypothetical protein
MHALHAIFVNVKDILEGMTLIPNPENFSRNTGRCHEQSAELCVGLQ